ncbi:hypothetical protein X777_15098 [Ooceraea biroi]|uniref:Uncharacterized protein n=1 Tax=Ooceraea biroi TaxID=2015173 RepID=A0A026WWT0_OOCBI|nr:hypothetical protein X777_15098 [Ooceraea biroi]
MFARLKMELKPSEVLELNFQGSCGSFPSEDFTSRREEATSPTFFFLFLFCCIAKSTC